MGSGAGKQKASKKYAPGDAAATAPSPGGSSPSKAGSPCTVVHEPSAKRSRVADAVEQAKQWSKAEIEQLPVPQLCRWLEALHTDFSSAVRRDVAAALLWQHIEAARPPALAAVDCIDHLQYWPVPETIKWLEYFGAADERVADKGALVQLLLDHGEELPAPTFLGESAEDAFITQVTQHIAMVKNAATTLLAQLSRDTAAVEAQERAKHKWHPNGRVVSEFKTAEIEGAFGAAQGGYLDAAVGEALDITVHEASGWAWCIKDEAVGGAQGWLPASSLVEVASVVEDHSMPGEAGEELLLLRKGDEVEVLMRHYSGWSLCRPRPGSRSRPATPAAAAGEQAPAGHEGWVPDACLSDHPRNETSKKYRLVLNGLQRLADDATAVELAFFQFRAQGPEVVGSTLEGLYNQVLALVEEYRSICGVVQLHAAADEQAAQERQAAREATRTEERAKAKEAEEAWMMLPGWVVEGKRAYWVSRVQKKWLRVHIKKVCKQRRQILVTFESDTKARKVVSFDAFTDMATCPLQRSKARVKKRRASDGDFGLAREALEDAYDDLNEELRDIVKDLGPDSMISADDEDESSDSDSDSGDATMSTASGSLAGGDAEPPSEQRPVGAAASPSTSAASASKPLPSSEDAAAADAKAGGGVDGISEASDGEEDGDVLAGASARAAAAAAVVACCHRFLAVELLWALRRTAAATRLEALARGAAARRRTRPRLDARQRAASRIQGLAKMRRARRQLAAFKLGKANFQSMFAIVIQRWYRGHRGRTRSRKLKADWLQLVLPVQSLWRAGKAALLLGALREVAAATTVQRWARGGAQRRRHRALLAKRFVAASRVQGLRRMLGARMQLRELRATRAALALRKTIKIQSWWRGEKARRYVRELFPVVKARHQAALRIQGLGRIRRARKKLRLLREERRALEARSATKLQSLVRGRRIRRALAPRLEARRQAALRIQGLQKMRQAKRALAELQAQRLAKLTAASTVIQAWCRGTLERQRLLPVLTQKRFAALRIQGLAKIRRARKEVRRIRAAIVIQSFWRGRLARRAVQQRRALLGGAARLIQRRARGLRARRQVRPVLLLRRRAVVRIQAGLRGLAARRRVRTLRRARAVLQVQCAWRRVLGRRELLGRQARKLEALLETLWKADAKGGDEALGAGLPEQKGAAWVEKVAAAMDWKDKADQVEEVKEWQRRRLAAEAAALEGPALPLSLQVQRGALLDRELAAAAAARTRARLRNRALLLTQVNDGQEAAVDAKTVRALVPEESLMARLSIVDACEEVSSMLKAAWVITVAGRGRRPRGVPKPDELAKSSLKMLLRRLNGELRHRKDLDKAEGADYTLRLLTMAETAATVEAENQAQGMRGGQLKAMKAELASACKEGKEAGAAVRQALDKLAKEVQALRDRKDAESRAAEEALRKERLDLHGQHIALHELTMTMQVEKERMEAELNERKPRGKVFKHVLATIKTLQEQLKEQEVNGTTNRKSQGLLAHTLRALESRAAKGLSEALSKMREQGLTVEEDNEPIPEVKLSATLQKKQDKHAESERAFYAALEAEVAKANAEREAKKKREVAVFGAQLRKEAEAFCPAMARAVERLTAWKVAADRSRPWLGELVPTARTHATAAAAVEFVHSATPEFMPVTLRAVHRRLEALLLSLTGADQERSPRPGELEPVLAKLAELQRSIAQHRKEFPDISAEELEAIAKAEMAAAAAAAAAALEVDNDGDFDSPVHGVVRQPEPPSPQAERQSAWANLASLGKAFLDDAGAEAAAPAGPPGARPPGAKPPARAAAPAAAAAQVPPVRAGARGALPLARPASAAGVQRPGARAAGNKASARGDPSPVGTPAGKRSARGR